MFQGHGGTYVNLVTGPKETRLQEGRAAIRATSSDLAQAVPRREASGIAGAAGLALSFPFFPGLSRGVSGAGAELLEAPECLYSHEVPNLHAPLASNLQGMAFFSLLGFGELLRLLGLGERPLGVDDPDAAWEYLQSLPREQLPVFWKSKQTAFCLPRPFGLFEDERLDPPDEELLDFPRLPLPLPLPFFFLSAGAGAEGFPPLAL